METDRQMEYWAHMLDEAMEDKCRYPAKSLPDILYHATPAVNTQSILKNGLIVGGNRRYGISRKVVCLTNSKAAALDFLYDGAESVSGKNFDEDDITLFEIRTRDLDISKLAPDPNKKTPENADPDKDIFYLEYRGNIPPDRLKIADDRIEDFDFDGFDLDLNC